MSVRNAVDRLSVLMGPNWIELHRCCGLGLWMRVDDDAVEFAAGHDGEYRVRVPGDKLQEFLENFGVAENQTEEEDRVQYPEGTDLLWMANYRKDPDGGDTNGPSYKLSGTFQQAAEEANMIAVTKGLTLQCLRRRY